MNIREAAGFHPNGMPSLTDLPKSFSNVQERSSSSQSSAIWHSHTLASPAKKPLQKPLFFMTNNINDSSFRLWTT